MLGKGFKALALQLRRWIRALMVMDLGAKLKMLFAFCQLAAALPSVYGLSHSTIESIWGQTFELMDLDMEQILIPGICVGGSFLTKLTYYSIFPLVAMALILGGGAARHYVTARSKGVEPTAEGLLQGLPAVLIIMFALVPMISSKIFSAFVCRFLLPPGCSLFQITETVGLWSVTNAQVNEVTCSRR